MGHLRLIISLVVLASGMVGSAIAKDYVGIAEHVWQIRKINGDAWVEVPGHERMKLTRNRNLFPGQTLITSSRTRLQLVRGKQRIQVGSSTMLALPDLRDLRPGHTTILQNRGTTHLTVDKRDLKHFSVKTPYMVAAVKGTQFTVTIDEKRADVRVHEGVVEVNNQLAQQIVDVTAGQSISMDVAAVSKLVRADAIGEWARQSDFLATVQKSTSKSISMAFMDRGDEHPELVEKRRSAAENGGYGADFVGSLLGLISGFLAFVFNLVGGVLHATINSLTMIVADFIAPAAGKVLDMDNLRFWVGCAMAFLSVSAIVASVVLYRVARRKETQIDLSRTGM